MVIANNVTQDVVMNDDIYANGEEFEGVSVQPRQVYCEISTRSFGWNKEKVKPAYDNSLPGNASASFPLSSNIYNLYLVTGKDSSPVFQITEVIFPEALATTVKYCSKFTNGWTRTFINFGGIEKFVEYFQAKVIFVPILSMRLFTEVGEVIIIDTGGVIGSTYGNGEVSFPVIPFLSLGVVMSVIVGPLEIVVDKGVLEGTPHVLLSVTVQLNATPGWEDDGDDDDDTPLITGWEDVGDGDDDDNDDTSLIPLTGWEDDGDGDVMTCVSI